VASAFAARTSNILFVGGIGFLISLQRDGNISTRSAAAAASAFAPGRQHLFVSGGIGCSGDGNISFVSERRWLLFAAARTATSRRQRQRLLLSLQRDSWLSLSAERSQRTTTSFRQQRRYFTFAAAKGRQHLFVSGGVGVQRGRAASVSSGIISLAAAGTATSAPRQRRRGFCFRCGRDGNILFVSGGIGCSGTAIFVNGVAAAGTATSTSAAAWLLLSLQRGQQHPFRQRRHWLLLSLQRGRQHLFVRGGGCTKVNVSASTLYSGCGLICQLVCCKCSGFSAAVVLTLAMASVLASTLSSTALAAAGL
jgi:ferredoxin-NADP reductase